MRESSTRPSLWNRCEVFHEYNFGTKTEIASAVGDLRKDFKQELIIVRKETKAEFEKVRSENKIAGENIQSQFEKMEVRLVKLRLCLMVQHHEQKEEAQTGTCKLLPADGAQMKLMKP